MGETYEYDPWKVVVVANTRQVGLLMTSFLESEDISARIANDVASQYEIIGSGDIMRGARIEVRESDVDRAIELLKDRQNSDFRFNDEALIYPRATQEELNDKIKEHTPATGSVPFFLEHWQPIGFCLFLAGLVFGLSEYFDAGGIDAPEERRNGILLTLVFGVLIVMIMISSRRSKDDED